jgi:phage shock protein E
MLYHVPVLKPQAVAPTIPLPFPSGRRAPFLPPLLPVLALIATSLAGGGCDWVLALGTSADRIDAKTLDMRRSATVTVDLRPREAFEAGHIPGSLHIAELDLNGTLARTALPRDQALVLVHETTTRALLFVPTAKLHGFERTTALEGGVQEWTRLGLAMEQGLPRNVLSGAPATAPPVQVASRLQQIVAFVSGAMIKPTYMLLSIVILVGIARLKKKAAKADGPQRSTGMDILGHGVRWFLVGETFCAINYYFHPTGIVFPIDVLHGAGMVAMSALIPWGLFRLLDERLFHYSDPGQHCMAQRFCGRCWKQEGVRCGPHDVMLVVAAGLAIVALMPWSSDLRPTYVVINILGTPVDYGQPIVNHLVELRLYPVIGVVMLLAALLFLNGGPRSIARAEPLFFVGFGFMSYPMLRHLLINAFREALYWSDFWEELTELFMILVVGLTLIVFRHQLAGQTRPRAAAVDGGEVG